MADACEDEPLRFADGEYAQATWGRLCLRATWHCRRGDAAGAARGPVRDPLPGRAAATRDRAPPGGDGRVGLAAAAVTPEVSQRPGRDRRTGRDSPAPGDCERKSERGGSGRNAAPCGIVPWGRNPAARPALNIRRTGLSSQRFVGLSLSRASQRPGSFVRAHSVNRRRERSGSPLSSGLLGRMQTPNASATRRDDGDVRERMSRARPAETVLKTSDAWRRGKRSLGRVCTGTASRLARCRGGRALAVA